MPALKLQKSLAAWGTEAFAATFKAELEAIPPADLGLQQAANWPLQCDAPVEVSLLTAEADASAVHARVGVFFTETIAGCACGDAPMQRQSYADLAIVQHNMTP